MKKLLVLTMGLICASFYTNAQGDILYHPILDSIQKCPFLYGYYNWDDVLEDCRSSEDCSNLWTSLTAGFSSSDLMSFQHNAGEIAFHQHSDSVLHAIGIAVKPPVLNNPPHGHFFLGLYDSNMVLQREMTPVAYYHYDQDADMPPNLYYRFYIPGGHITYLSDRQNAATLMFSFFDESIDISGDFYLSIGEQIEPHYPDGLSDVWTWREFHAPPYHFGNHNIKWYQKELQIMG